MTGDPVNTEQGRSLERLEGDPPDHPAASTELPAAPFSLGGEELLVAQGRLSEVEAETSALREQVLGLNLRVSELARRLAALERGRRR
jgi:hypothetical protein